MLLIDLADELNTGFFEERLDLCPVLYFIHAVHLGRDLERNAKRPRNLDSAIDALLR